MNCRKCKYMEDFRDWEYRCWNENSDHYMKRVGMVAEDGCPDGEQDEEGE